MRATDSTHCSRGVDTEPPPNFFGMPAEDFMAGAALQQRIRQQIHTETKSLRHGGSKRKLPQKRLCRQPTSRFCSPSKQQPVKQPRIQADRRRKSAEFHFRLVGKDGFNSAWRVRPIDGARAFRDWRIPAMPRLSMESVQQPRRAFTSHCDVRHKRLCGRSQMKCWYLCQNGTRTL